MSTVPRSMTARRAHLPQQQWIRFRPAALPWLVVITAVTIFLAVGHASPMTRMLVGNFGIAGSLLFSTAVCLRAARLRNANSRGWAWMSAAMTMGALGQLVFTYAVIKREEQDSGFSDVLGYLGYALPAVVALFVFPKPPERLISRFRSVLDAAVITLGVVLVSQATVLHQVQVAPGLSTVERISGLAFPVVDLTICAVVLTLGMRQSPANRLIWLCLGAGLVCLAVTDSIYVDLRADGMPYLTGTVLVAGWMAAPVLVGLATLIPPEQQRRGWDLALPVRLVPYAPVLAAMIVVGIHAVGQDPLLLVEAVLLLLTVAARQVMIVYENLTLTRDLEDKVLARTAELAIFGSIVTSSSDAIVGLSLSNVVTTWNPAAERLYGYRAADVVGRSPEFLPPRAQEWIRAVLEQARRGDPFSTYEVDWSRPDGSEVPVSMTVSPILDGREVDGISIIGQDITDRRQSAANLEQAREDALESSRLKSDFLATMSHEIRTPMNGVIGLTSLLVETDLDAVQRKYAEGVQSAGQSLLDVINDILDFSKLEAGKVIIEEDDFDLRRLVEEVGNLLAPAAFAKGLELLVSCPPDTPAVVRGDHVRIRQILLNLASNAVKFTAVGEVAVKVEAHGLDSGHVGLRFEVIDTGIGIAEKDQLRLFESFSQADASTTRRFGGTGLGLAICRRLTEVMGGSIGLQSEPGSGSTFWFEIPLPLGSSDIAPPTPPRHDLLTGLRVLVVDDNATNRTILDAQLTSWRMEAALIDNATSALAELRDAESRGQGYDLVLLDMMMPDVDGLELAQYVTADPALAGMPMIMLTSAQRLPSSVLRDAGIGQWMTKPVSSSELFDRLVRLLSPDVREPRRRPPTPPVTEPEPSRGRVLVVEDNALNQLVAAGLIERLGYTTDTVGNGVEALAAMETTIYDAVLMDCHMPVMDGFTATRELRRRQCGSTRTPVIALTAGALVSDRERCLAAGMDDYISKPVDFEALEQTLSRWIQTPDRGSAAAPAEDAAAVGTDAPLDWSRLDMLRDLQAPDGSSLITSFVNSFNARAANRMAALRGAVQAGDHEALAQAAHELKGSAATIGAVQVAATCGLLEHAGREREAAAPELLERLHGELDRATAALSAALSPVPSP